MNLDDLHMHSPCNECPFTPQGVGPITIGKYIKGRSFICHKTIHSERRQCAGHMLMAPHNEFVELAKRFGIKLNLSGRDRCFGDIQQMIDHHTAEDEW